MSSKEGKPETGKGKYPIWVQYGPGIVGGLWLLGCLAYVFWTMVLSPDVTPLGKVLLSGVCLGGIAFVVTTVLPLRGQDQIQPSDIGDFWSFLKGARPEDPARYALWRKFRTTSAILLMTLLLWFAWGIAVSLGLARRLPG